MSIVLNPERISGSERAEAVMAVLQAVRAFSDAMDRTHSGMKGDMDMNASDLAALRMMIMREQEEQPVTPRDVARHLRISTASTTKLLDRLEDAGHVQRGPHARDRRARVVTLTDQSRQEFYRHFGARLQGMRGVADSYSNAELAMVARFLGDVSAGLDPGTRG